MVNQSKAQLHLDPSLACAGWNLQAFVLAHLRIKVTFAKLEPLPRTEDELLHMCLDFYLCSAERDQWYALESVKQIPDKPQRPAPSPPGIRCKAVQNTPGIPPLFSSKEWRQFSKGDKKKWLRRTASRPNRRFSRHSLRIQTYPYKKTLLIIPFLLGGSSHLVSGQ